MLNRLFTSGDQAAVVRIANFGCPVELRRSPRAKRFSLKVSHTERTAILTLPPRGKVEDANAFLVRHSDWLRKQIDRLPDPVPFVDGAVVPLRGDLHSLNFVGLHRDKGVVWIDTRQTQACELPSASLTDWRALSCLRADVSFPKLCVNGAEDYAPRRFADWLKSEVRKDLAVCVERHAKTLNCSPKRISVRDQATRWGSCSTTGTLSFSWRLIFAPPFVLDYVAAHEVAHLREMNHGPRFWRLVREAFPGMHKARAWLKANGAELHRFGVPG